MGGSVYVKKALGETTAKVEQFCEQLISLDHPQIGFILLRQCCGTCRVVHLIEREDTHRHRDGNGAMLRRTKKRPNKVTSNLMADALINLRASSVFLTEKEKKSVAHHSKLAISIAFALDPSEQHYPPAQSAGQ